MGKPKSMLLEIDAWFHGTERMHHKWRGPYLDLCLHIFNEGGSVPNNPESLARRARLTPRQFEIFWTDVGAKFLVSEDEIRHKKAGEALARYDEVVTKLRQNGARGGKKTQQKQRERQAIAKATQHNVLSNDPKGSNYSTRDDRTEKASIPVSPPSPERGGGDTTDGEDLTALRRWLQSRVMGLMTAHVLSAREVRELKDSIRGGSEDCLWLAPQYHPPDHVASALESIAVDWKHLPQLKAIEGGKS